MEQWEKNFYISAIAGANNGSSLVVMSKGSRLNTGVVVGFDDSIFWKYCDQLHDWSVDFFVPYHQ